MSVYFIQGFFIQQSQWLELGFDRNIGGVAALVKEGICRFMFAGIIHPDETNVLGGFVGRMDDIFGHSFLKSIHLLPQRLTFTKHYIDRQDEIEYEFHKSGSLWLGEYHGDAVGSGTAKCIVTEVPDNIMLPRP